MRLFFCIDPPAALQRQINTLCPRLKGVRPTPPEQLHLTLLFLGEQPDDILAEVTQPLQELSFAPMEVEFDTVGHFRSGVIWLGIKPNPPLIRLQKKLHNLLSQQGFQLEQRKFKPHITLARCKTRLTPHLMQSFTQAFEEQHFCFRTDHLLLKSSELTEKGAIHRTEAEWLAG
ncbi:MAG: RNA 2',3'-cyclic phosphodiesterase [Amphritea sp.]